MTGEKSFQSRKNYNLVHFQQQQNLIFCSVNITVLSLKSVYQTMELLKAYIFTHIGIFLQLLL